MFDKQAGNFFSSVSGFLLLCEAKDFPFDNLYNAGATLTVAPTHHLASEVIEFNTI